MNFTSTWPSVYLYKNFIVRSIGLVAGLIPLGSHSMSLSASSFCNAVWSEILNLWLLGILCSAPPWKVIPWMVLPWKVLQCFWAYGAHCGVFTVGRCFCFSYGHCSPDDVKINCTDLFNYAFLNLHEDVGIYQYF